MIDMRCPTRPCFWSLRIIWMIWCEESVWPGHSSHISSIAYPQKSGWMTVVSQWGSERRAWLIFLVVTPEYGWMSGKGGSHREDEFVVLDSKNSEEEWVPWACVLFLRPSSFVSTARHFIRVTNQTLEWDWKQTNKMLQKSYFYSYGNQKMSWPEYWQTQSLSNHIANVEGLSITLYQWLPD